MSRTSTNSQTCISSTSNDRITCFISNSHSSIANNSSRFTTNLSTASKLPRSAFSGVTRVGVLGVPLADLAMSVAQVRDQYQSIICYYSSAVGGLGF
mmetsp:Transcript_26561/g.52352  ORF Transcript_26561/g.52352 Transcript_26561/m.52352 type:complete len:97 (-) Transcript_26561:67-357(-)